MLIFLLIDTFLDAMEVAEGLVGAFQGVPLILFAVLITWLVLLAVGGREHRRPAAAILGTLVGGFAFSPLLATLFLGIGVGAIWQVIVEAVGLLRS